MRVSTIGACLLLASLALAGCTTIPIPVGHTDAQLQEYLDAQNASYWSMSPFGAEEPPDVDVVRFTDQDDFNVVAHCMEDAGVDVEFGDDGSMSWSWTTDDEANNAALAQYTCQAQYPYYPPQQGYITGEQSKYLYEYYKRVLIPCLALEGYVVTEAPTKGEFALDSGWNPYWVFDRSGDNYSEQQALLDECPMSPFQVPESFDPVAD